MYVCVILRIYNYQFLSHPSLHYFGVLSRNKSREGGSFRFPRLAGAIYPLAGRCGLRINFRLGVHIYIYMCIYINMIYI